MKAFKAFEDLGREELIYFERSAITLWFLIVGEWGGGGGGGGGGVRAIEQQEVGITKSKSQIGES